LCINLVIKTSLYYDARLEKHQIMIKNRCAWWISVVTSTGLVNYIVLMFLSSQIFQYLPYHYVMFMLVKCELIAKVSLHSTIVVTRITPTDREFSSLTFLLIMSIKSHSILNISFSVFIQGFINTLTLVHFLNGLAQTSLNRACPRSAEQHVPNSVSSEALHFNDTAYFVLYVVIKINNKFK
jgi:hypothetical protein